MATVINNPSSDTGGGAGVLLGIIVAVIIITLFFVYALPGLRGLSRSGGTNINVPDKVDINVNKSAGQQTQ